MRLLILFFCSSCRSARRSSPPPRRRPPATITGTLVGRERRRAAGRLGDGARHRHGSLAHGRDRSGGTVRRRRRCRPASTTCARSWPASSRTCARTSSVAVATTVNLNITLQIGDARDRRCRRRRDAARQHVDARSSATSSARKRSSGCRSTAATTPTWRCCSPASTRFRTATADRSSRTASA